MSEKTVLIIDDEDDLRETVGYFFKSRGFNVLTAVDGLDGLEKLETIKPDLIILDMNMPRMNGLEFYEKIKGYDEKPPYPILVLTARANMEKLFKDLEVDGFMAKPFELEELFSESNKIIKRHALVLHESAGTGALRAPKVCIVENDKETFSKISLVFLEQGYLVHGAHSGASAIQRITMDIPDYVVISMGLADISGDVVIDKLKRINKTKEVKYILYTTKYADMDKTIILQRIAEKEGITKFVESNHPDALIAAVASLAS